MRGAKEQLPDINHRMSKRLPFVRSAKILAETFAVDAFVTNLSADGLQVHCERWVIIPDEVTIELNSGEVWRALRRWQRGLRAGFHFSSHVG